MNLFFAQTAYANGVDTFVAKVDKVIVNPIISFLFAVALVYFLFGVFQFIANPESEDKKTAGKSHMLWGVVGLTIMMAVWTILNIILHTFNISPSEINPEQGQVNLKEYTPPNVSNVK